MGFSRLALRLPETEELDTGRSRDICQRFFRHIRATAIVASGTPAFRVRGASRWTDMSRECLVHEHNPQRRPCNLGSSGRGQLNEGTYLQNRQTVLDGVPYEYTRTLW